MKFKLTVTSDPARILRGVLRAELTSDGLILTRPKGEPLLIPVHTPAAIPRGNVVTIHIDGRDVTFKVSKFSSYNSRLARLVVETLYPDGGRRTPVNIGIEWYLVAASFLPIGIVLLTLGGAVWGALTAVLIGLNFMLAQLETVPRFVRLGLIAMLSLFGYLILFVAVAIAVYTHAATPPGP